MIRTILFDLDDTLLDRTAAHQRYCLDLIVRHPEIFTVPQGEAHASVLLDGDHPDVRSFARHAARTFPALGTTAAIATDYARRLPQFIERDESVIKLLESLRATYQLGLVSNGRGETQRAKLAAAGLSALSRRAIISGEEGVAKPDPALFAKALARLSATARETLFVGDDPTADVAGAAQVGMRTCWVSRGRSFPACLPRPDCTIETVHRLPELLP